MRYRRYFSQFLHSNPGRRLRRAEPLRRHPALEVLQERTLLSNIEWTNVGGGMGDFDNFGATYGANADRARAPVGRIGSSGPRRTCRSPGRRDLIAGLKTRSTNTNPATQQRSLSCSRISQPSLALVPRALDAKGWNIPKHDRPWRHWKAG